VEVAARAKKERSFMGLALMTLLVIGMVLLVVMGLAQGRDQ